MTIPESFDQVLREMDRETSRALRKLQKPGRRNGLERDLVEALMPLYQHATGEPVTRNGPSFSFLQAAIETWRTAIRSRGLRTTFPPEPDALRVALSTAVRGIKTKPSEEP
jgi:hypothetical protein